MTAFERQVALNKAANAAMAKKYPQETSFAKETSLWFPKLDGMSDLPSKVMAALSFYGLLSIYSIVAAIIILWIFSIIAKAIIHGISSREVWVTVLSLFMGCYEFGRFFCVLFRLVADRQEQPTAPPSYYSCEH